jgi:hypothetical protein
MTATDTNTTANITANNIIMMLNMCTCKFNYNCRPNTEVILRRKVIKSQIFVRRTIKNLGVRYQVLQLYSDVCQETLKKLKIT